MIDPARHHHDRPASRRNPPTRPWSGCRLLPLAAALLLPQAALAQLPTADVQNTCRIAASAMVNLMGGTTIEQGLNGCLDSENTARTTIVKDWGTYSAADRSQCLQTGVYLPSYVEWLTCLEMERDVRKMRQQDREAAAKSKKL